MTVPRCSGAAANLCDAFYDHRSPIREHFSDTLHHLSRIVACTNHSISPEFACMLQHQVEGFAARLLTQVRQQRNVAANERLQTRADGSENGTGAYNDAANYSQRAHNAEAREVEG